MRIPVILVLAASFVLVPKYGAAGAGSPRWSMYGHDSAHTGRSPVDGPTTAHLAWKFELPVKAQDNASPVVGPDGTVYMPSESGFFAINPDGTLKWEKWRGVFQEPITRLAPAVAKDGIVYVWKANFLNGGRLFALDPHDGSVKWSFSVGDTTYGSPTIGPDGTIYMAGGLPGNLYAIHPDGTQKWVWHSRSRDCGIETSAALGPDGTVYIQHNCRGLVALWPNGKLKWDRYGGECGGGLGEAWDSPSVGASGTIYIGSSDYCFYAINPDRTTKWRVKVRNWMYYSSSAISADGSTIYRGDNGGVFYAISSSGHIRWTFQGLDHGTIFSAPALSANGLVYFMQDVNNRAHASLFALRASNGTIAWKAFLGASDVSPALAPDGTLYVAAPDHTRSGKETLYAFR